MWGWGKSEEERGIHFHLHIQSQARLGSDFMSFEKVFCGPRWSLNSLKRLERKTQSGVRLLIVKIVERKKIAGNCPFSHFLKMQKGNKI